MEKPFAEITFSLPYPVIYACWLWHRYINYTLVYIDYGCICDCQLTTCILAVEVLTSVLHRSLFRKGSSSFIIQELDLAVNIFSI